jgi:hypothetical protein
MKSLNLPSTRLDRLREALSLSQAAGWHGGESRRFLALRQEARSLAHAYPSGSTLDADSGSPLHGMLLSRL